MEGFDFNEILNGGGNAATMAVLYLLWRLNDRVTKIDAALTVLQERLRKVK